MPMNNFSYTLNGNTYTDETWTADPEASLAGTANDIAFIVDAVSNDLANFNWGGLAGGTANALTLTPSPALSPRIAGSRYVFTPNVDNTGAATLNVSGTGAAAIKRPNGDALVAGDLKAGVQAFVIFDGTNWKLTSWFPAAAVAFDPNEAVSHTVSDSFGTTLTGANLAAKIIIRTGPLTDFVDTPDTAANIVAGASEPFVGGYFPVMLINSTGKKWTISGGTGITYGSPDGASVSIPSGCARILYVSFSNVGGGTEAVKIYGGTETIAGDFSVAGNLAVVGNISTGGNLTVTHVTGTGNASFGGTLGVTGATALGGSLSVAGNANFTNRILITAEPSVDGFVRLNSDAGAGGWFEIYSGGLARWLIGKNAGENLTFIAFADDGVTPIGNPIEIERLTGHILFNLALMPTSASGLVAGTLFSDSGVLTLAP